MQKRDKVLGSNTISKLVLHFFTQTFPQTFRIFWCSQFLSPPASWLSLMRLSTNTRLVRPKEANAMDAPKEVKPEQASLLMRKQEWFWKSLRCVRLRKYKPRNIALNIMKRLSEELFGEQILYQQ